MSNTDLSAADPFGAAPFKPPAGLFSLFYLNQENVCLLSLSPAVLCLINSLLILHVRTFKCLSFFDKFKI